MCYCGMSSKRIYLIGDIHGSRYLTDAYQADSVLVEQTRAWGLPSRQHQVFSCVQDDRPEVAPHPLWLAGGMPQGANRPANSMAFRWLVGWLEAAPAARFEPEQLGEQSPPHIHAAIINDDFAVEIGFRWRRR